ncbi:DUF192 domain-containing protein [Candidatus Woesearchaeota archaeon]|nr:DUF192 domain-containing protein [Candidatus Woesearchaeota archaeon]
MKILFALLILLLVACSSKPPQVIVLAGVQEPVITVELATTQAEWERGLMGRDDVKDGEGMLFIFPNAEIKYFWMKSTNMPLDILFITSNYKITKIIENAQPCDQGCENYSSDIEVQYVLEVPGGYAKEHGIKRGQEVIFLRVSSG